MNDYPTVSIIIPTFNRIEFLQKTLDSILKQTYKDFEVIIISDASTDNTSAIVNKYNDKRINFFELKENLKYPSRVRNIGIEKSKGEFIAFCDDDDFWIEKKLEDQMKFIKANSNIDLVASNSFLFPGYIVPSMQLWRNKILKYNELLKSNSIITPSVLIRKSTLNQVGLFDESEKLHIGEDWDLWLRVIQHKEKSIIILKKCLVYNRIGNTKITNTHFNPAKFREAKVYIYEKHKPFKNFKTQSNFYEKNADSQKISRVNLRQETTKGFYSKKISTLDLLNSQQLTLKEKIIIMGKFFSKYSYKILVQNRFLNNNY